MVNMFCEVVIVSLSDCMKKEIKAEIWESDNLPGIQIVEIGWKLAV